MHTPICPVCNTYEVGTFHGGTDEYCSTTCEGAAHAEMDALRVDPYEYDAVGDGWGYDDCERMQDECVDGEPEGSYDLSDDAAALASAGWGTDEDYGYYGDDF